MARLPHRGAQRGRRDQGFALLIVLWAIVLLSLLFTHLVSAGRSEAEIASNLRAAAKLQAQADGLIYSIIFGLLGGPGGPWQANGRMHKIRISSETAAVSIDNLAGRINPNTASPALLEALLHDCGADAVTARKLSQAIVDWRSPNAQGAFEAPRYVAAGLPYSPAESPFQSIGELSLVFGMTPKLLARIAPHLSVYTEDNPDFLYADSTVRAALRDAGMAAVVPHTPKPPRTVSINVAIRAPNGAEASRHADVELNSSQAASGFAILTWTNKAE